MLGQQFLNRSNILNLLRSGESTSLEDYSRQIPAEIRRALDGLYNDTRLGIFLAIMKHGELSFSEIGSKVGMQKDKSKLAFHLNKLTENALVEHFYRHQIGNEKFSFYTVTDFGKAFWNGMISSLRPTPQLIKMEESSGKYITQLHVPTALANSENYLILITDPAKEHKQKFPKSFSDRVNYGKAVIEGE